MDGYLTKKGKTYYLVIYQGVTPEGKEKRKWLKSGKTKREAEVFKAKTMANYHSGGFVEPSSLTVAEYLGRWLEEDVRLRLRRRTVESYELIVKEHLIPALGHYLLSKLQPLDIQSYFHIAHRKDGRDGELSDRTVHYHFSVLRRALNMAVKWQLISRNPCLYVDPPKARRQVPQVWTPEQVLVFWQATEAAHLGSLFRAAILTRMRLGELLALRWSDMDIPNQVVHVRQALAKGGKHPRFERPKSEAGFRSIPLSDDLLAVLTTQRSSQAEDSRLRGPAYEDYGLIWQTTNGTPYIRHNVYRSFVRLSNANGLPQIPFHALRHTNISLMIALGAAVKTVSSLAGHSSASFTLHQYAHFFRQVEMETAASLGRFLNSGDISKSPNDQPHEESKSTQNVEDR